MSSRVIVFICLAAVSATAFGCGSSSSSPSTQASAAPATTQQAPPAKEVSPAGDIPDNQAYVAYAPPGGGFSVKVPEGWARTTNGAVTTFTDKLNSIAMETTAKADTSTSRLTNAKASTVQRTAGPATRITYLVESAADPVTGKRRVNAVERYVFSHAGHDIVLTLTGPKGADNVDPWKIVTDSLRYTA